MKVMMFQGHGRNTNNYWHLYLLRVHVKCSAENPTIWQDPRIEDTLSILIGIVSKYGFPASTLTVETVIFHMYSSSALIHSWPLLCSMNISWQKLSWSKFPTCQNNRICKCNGRDTRDLLVTRTKNVNAVCMTSIWRVWLDKHQ